MGKGKFYKYFAIYLLLTLFVTSSGMENHIYGKNTGTEQVTEESEKLVNSKSDQSLEEEREVQETKDVPPKEDQGEGIHDVKDLSNFKMLAKSDTGLLTLNMAGNTNFEPLTTNVQVMAVNYIPRKEGISRKLVISGLNASGIIAELPVITYPITSASLSSNKDTLTINFDNAFVVGSTISFNLPIKVDVINEKIFTKALSKDTDQNPFINGIQISEYVDETIDQKETSHLPVSFTMQESDLKTDGK